MQIINGYQLLQPLTSKNAGTCLWGVCRKGENSYFIKKFLAPHYPSPSSGLTEATMQKKIDRCIAFYQEKKELYQTLTNCRTGNVIVTEAFFRWDSDFYAVTEFVSSEGTDPTIISGLPMKEKFILMRSLAFSLQILHSAGIIHADLKPENILLVKTPAGCFTGKIIDFDSSYLSGKMPREIQGDPVYLAPESFLRMNETDAELTTAVDIFALGLIFHQYLTGELPAFSSEYHYPFESVLNGAALTPSAKIPAGLWHLIERMLLCDPQQRPCAEEVFSILKREAPREDFNPFSSCGDL